MMRYIEDTDVRYNNRLARPMKTDEALERFSVMMISRMLKMKASDWKKGWFTKSFGGNPINLTGRQYNGINSFFLFLCMMDNDCYKYPIFATFKQVKALGASVNKGEKSFPVLFWNIQYKDQNGNRISEDCYNGMSPSAQQGCVVHPFLKSYNVFNLAQTNLEKAAPATMKKLKDKFGPNDCSELPTDTFGMYENTEIDDILHLQKWVCPIRYDQYSSRAYYRLSSDEITVPQKSQFKTGVTEQEIYENGQEFYSTLLHEMIHSTGSEKRLNRRIENEKGGRDYAREELVAELGAALISNTLGFSSRVLDNSAAYLDAWIARLKKHPKYIVSVLSDVNKAAKMFFEVVGENSMH